MLYKNVLRYNLIENSISNYWQLREESYGFGYDQSGNMLSDDAGSSRYLEYNYAGKLRAFRTQGGTSEPSVFAHYLYDSGGNRVKKLVRKQGGGYKSTSYIDGLYEHSKASTFTDSIPYLRIGTWSVGGEEGEQSLHHILDGASRIATLRTGAELGDNTPAVKYNLEDHLNSSCILLDANGTLINKEEYTPFGETSFGSYGRKRYRYNGKEKDEESGLYNYGMRYYAPWMCRFVSVDPLAPDYPFYTPYQYAGNKPINARDIDGLEEEGGSNQGGGVTGVNFDRDNTRTESPPVTKDLLESINNESQDRRSSILENESLLGEDNTSEDKTSTNHNIKGDKTDTLLSPFRDMVIEQTMERSGKELIEGADSELAKMSSEGYMKTNTGKLVKTSRMKEAVVNGETIKKPVNFGWKQNGIVHTTKGIELHTTKTTYMKRMGGALTHSGSFFNLLTLSQIAIGKEPSYKALDIILPLSIISDWKFVEIDMLHLEIALKEGYDKTVNLLENSDIPARLIYVSAGELEKIHSGAINQISQLSDPSNRNQSYGLLIDMEKHFNVYGGFYLGK